MNYQSFGRELTLFLKNTYNFSMTTMRVYFEYNLAKGFNNEYQKIFMIIIDPLFNIKLLSHNFLKSF